MPFDPMLPVAVVCGQGRDSRVVAAHLNSLGARALSLAGGLAAWSRLVVPRVLRAPASVDTFVQFDRIAKGDLGYLVISAGEAFVADPPLDYATFAREAANRGARIVGVADTHVHADYVSGASRLAREYGVPYYLHPADTEYPYDGRPGRVEILPIADGDVIRVGRANVRVHHNPGHTLGSVSYVIDDSVAMTGDFLFVGSVGRPDLAGKTAAWTELLWESVERARREWSADLTVYPAHYGGERERNADRSVGATVSQLLVSNPALQHATAADFAAWVAASVGSFPDTYRTIKAVNIGLVDVTDDEAEELEVGRNECALGKH